MRELVIAKPKEKKNEVLEAEKSYIKMMKEIKPFIKKKRTSTHSDTQWEISNYQV